MRTSRSLMLLMAFVAATAVLSARADTTFGKGVTVKDVTSIKALYETPDAFVGKTIRIDGVVTAVCQEMGCWMALAAKKDGEETIRFKVEHEGSIVFPISAKGKKASAEGVFEKIGAMDHESHDAAAEHTAATPTSKAAAFGQMYQIKAIGAVIK